MALLKGNLFIDSAVQDILDLHSSVSILLHELYWYIFIDNMPIVVSSYYGNIQFLYNKYRQVYRG